MSHTVPDLDSSCAYGERLTRLAAAEPRAIALACDGESGTQLVTRIELETRSNRLARALAELGAAAGDFVTLAVPNGADFFVAAFACWKLGAVPNPLSHRLPAAERAAMVDVEGEAVTRDEAAAAWRAIDRLDEDRRQAIVLRFVHELSTSEMAGVLGRSTIGGNSGTISLLYSPLLVSNPQNNPFGCDFYMYGIAVHEITHTLGFYHTLDLINDSFSGPGCTGTGRPERTRFHSSIMYSRPAGNTDPDVDPASGAQLVAPGPFPGREIACFRQ